MKVENLNWQRRLLNSQYNSNEEILRLYTLHIVHSQGYWKYNTHDKQRRV